MKEISCKIAQKGFCAGNAVLIKAPSLLSFAACEDLSAEKEKFREVLLRLREEMKKQAAEASPETAKILEADRLILEDEEFSKAVLKVLEEKRSSLAYAVQEGSRELAGIFETNDSEYIRQRAADVRGLGQRLIGVIENRRGAKLSGPSVVIAEEMTPGSFSELDRENLLGLITVKGAASSHVSIMAGNLGIPYVYGVPSLEDLSAASYVILDADAGKLIIDPDGEMQKTAEAEMLRRREEQEKALRQAENIQPKTKVYINISNLDDLEALRNSSADGVGLFRSEFLYLGSDHAPEEEEQYAAYKAILEAAGGRDVVIRTMDIGSDKQASWLDLPEEKNPALGTRGIRLSFRHPDLFRTQLRALLRAAVLGKMIILFPMITSEWEVDAIKKAMRLAAAKLESQGIPYRIPPIGIMIETPAAALIADRLAKKVQYFSIGTNDLTQYTIALDREAEGLEDFYVPNHEAMLRLIKQVCEAGHKEGIYVAVCGELASNPDMIPKLIAAGVDELSVSASKVDRVRTNAAKAEKDLYFDLACPCDGQVLSMEEIRDPVFASGMLGQAVGVYPRESAVYAPVEGKLIHLAPSKHAFTIEGKDGQQVLVHVGIDTVKLNGKGFEALVKTGDELACGQQVLKVDFDLVKEAGFDPTVVVILVKQ